MKHITSSTEAILKRKEEHTALNVQCIEEGCGLVFATRQEMFAHYPVHVEDGDIDWVYHYPSFVSIVYV